MTHAMSAFAQTLAGLDGRWLPFVVRLACGVTAVWVLAGVAAVLLRRRGSAAMRHRVWSMSTLAALALPVLLLLAPEWRVGAIRVDAAERRAPMRGATAAEEFAPLAAADRPTDGSTDGRGLPARGADQVAGSLREQGTAGLPRLTSGFSGDRPSAAPRTTAVADPAAAAAEPSGSSADRRSVIWACAAVWLGVAGWLLARHALAVLAVLRLLGRGSPVADGPSLDSLRRLAAGLGVRAEPHLLESGEIGSPVCLGWLRPCIVLPEGWRDWPAEQLDAVLTHELAHVARRDVLWQLMARVAAALYWPHPLAWVAGWRMRVERELACDDWVLRGGQSSTRYARRLLNVATELRGRLLDAAGGRPACAPYAARAAEAVGVAMAARGGFERRIAAILDPRRRRRPVSRRTAWLLALVALAVLAAAGTLSPLAPTRAAAEPPKARPATQPSPAAADAPTTHPGTGAKTSRMAGRVEDESGWPVAGVRVNVSTGGMPSATQTGPDGRFSIEVEGRSYGYFHATTADGARQGFQTIKALNGERMDDVRLVLKPARELSVTVNDPQGKPVTGAWVTTVARLSMKMAEARTGADGKALLRVPADAPLDYVLAMKPDAGLDYVLFRSNDEPKTNPYKLDPGNTGPFTLILNGTTTVTVRVVDDQKRPLAGVLVYPWYFQTPKKGGDVNLAGLREFHQMTDVRGEAVFRTTPADNTGKVNFWARLDGYSAPARCLWDPKAGKNELETILVKQVPVTGRVLEADGRPAAGALVRVSGEGYQMDGFRGETTSSQDGSFHLDVDPDMYYLFVAGKEHHASATHLQIIRKEAAAPIELKLQPAARVYGAVTAGPDNAPMAGAYVTLVQEEDEGYYKLPKEEQFPGGTTGRKAIRPGVAQHATTDARGAFEFFTGSGDYSIFVSSPGASLNGRFKLAGEREHEENLHAKELRTAPKMISGRVVLADRPAEPAPEASLSGQNVGLDPISVQGTSDRLGHFTVRRGESDLYLSAKSGDDRLRGIILIKGGQENVTLPVGPTASARGRLIDPDGAPLDGRVIHYGVRIGPPNGPYFTSFGGNATTDADGLFTVEGLVPGYQYDLHMVTKFDEEGLQAGWQDVGKVKPDRAERVELGDLKLKPLPKPKTPQDYAAEAFERADPLPDRLDAARQTARLGFQNVLVLLGGPERPACRQFFELRENTSSLQIWDTLLEHVLVAVNLDRKEVGEAARRWAEQQNVRMPAAGTAALVVLDPEGHVLAQASADELSKNGMLNSSRLIEFARAHAPAKPDARKLLDDALAQARREDKRVLVDESAPSCGPCVRLAKYLEANRALIDKDFVCVTLDRRFANGKEVLTALRPKEVSTPWVVILTPEGKPVITSDGPEGNVGFPGDADGQAVWEKMLRAGAKRLSDNEIRKLLAKLKTP